MIIIKLSGGLGNQLFQYSFGRYLSLKFNTELKFDIQLNINNSNFTPRSLGLSKYKIDLNLASQQEISKYKLFSIQPLSRVERKIIQKFPFINKKMIIEESFKIINKELLPNNCYYEGYWQSEYYFKSISDIIRQDFQINFELDETNKIFQNKINNSLSISIHIRRGDYVSINSNTKIYSSCTIEYYQKAIDFFKLKFKTLSFFIFSDDIKWVKENFPDNNFEIVDINQDNPHADLYLMSMCKHNIVANSSFSWWGAWLNPNKNKIIVSPNKWYVNDETNSKAMMSLIPKDWTII